MSTNGNSKMVVVCNSDSTGVMPTFIMGASGVSIGEEVFLFFCPGGANVLLKGELEKFRGKKGLPDPVELYDTIREQGGHIILCELALANKDIDRNDLREGVEIMNAPSFLMAIEGAGVTFTF